MTTQSQSSSPKPPNPARILLPLLLLLLPLRAQSRCKRGCVLALASYYVSEGQNLTYISSLFGFEFKDINSKVLPYNPNISNRDSVQAGSRVNVPFACDCVDDEYLARAFQYTVLARDTYNIIARKYYANLTTPDWLEKVNSYPATNIPIGAAINATVNCSCGDCDVSRDYGLFVTYPLRAGDTLDSVAAKFQFQEKDMLLKYNPGVKNFSAGRGIVFVPTKDLNQSYRPLKSRKGISGGAVAGITIAAVVLLVVAVFSYVIYRRKKAKEHISGIEHPISHGSAITAPFMGITVDKSVEFSYEELAKATNDFNMTYKIGSGGFGDVYYAELRGEKTAIKKMDVQSSREFLAELKVLTHVHHLNLVRLIGYCTEESLFLVYEYIENGNLSQHLHGSERQPLSWSSRVQIALDSARGLEYIHEHTVPVYIHRDIKSPNILIDKNFHAKVADFGLAKLTEVGNISNTRLVGTFGYMPPEYAKFGDVSAKVDVYAFGVVLYELISAKQAIFKTNSSGNDNKGLVALFDEVLTQPDAEKELCKTIDPRLGDNYPIDAVYKMAQLGKACTQENPQIRPTMRSVVVKLMALSSNTEDWDVGPFYENHSLVSLVSGR